MQIALCLVVWPHPILPWTAQERQEMTWGGSGALRSCGPVGPGALTTVRVTDGAAPTPGAGGPLPPSLRAGSPASGQNRASGSCHPTSTPPSNASTGEEGLPGPELFQWGHQGHARERGGQRTRLPSEPLVPLPLASPHPLAREEASVPGLTVEQVQQRLQATELESWDPAR